MENTKELEGVIRGLLISSPKVTKANRLESDFDETEGRPFPFRKLGFPSFLEYLKSIPDVVQLVPVNSFNPDVLPIMSKESSHIEQLVSRQKIAAPSRKRSSSRRGGFHGFARRDMSFPSRRRPPVYYPPPQSRPAPNKGMYVWEVESQMREKYSRKEGLNRNGLHSVNDLPSRGNNMVERVNENVYPKVSYSPKSDYVSKQPSDMYQANCYPAGMEDEYESNSDYDEVNGFIEYDSIEYDKSLDNIDEKTISSYTIEHFKNISNDSPKGGENKVEFGEECTLDDHESDFSKGMIKNFQLILAKYPEGIWATELPQKYFEEFKVSLNLQDLGYPSAVKMASFLPNIFTYKRTGPHDWKLYDARLYNKQNYKLPIEEEETVFSGNVEENYVPKSILENIKQLVKQHPEGIRSSFLLSFYEREHNKKLDLEALGYKRLEDFLDIVKNIITIRKATDHYLLLPKHKTVSLDTMKSNAPEEVLKIPVDPYVFLGPENVLKPSDVIPAQELPPVKIDPKNPEEPLIEMEVRVGEVISPSLFYLILDSKFNELQNMMEDLEKFYQQEEKNYHILFQYLNVNLFCVCKYENSWHRAKITEMRTNDMVDIEYIDYGTPGRVKSSELRFLQSDFAKLPSQSICAKLIGINAIGGEKRWPTAVCREFLDIVTEKRLLAYVYHIGMKKKKERMQLDVILYDTSGPKEVICNEYLVENGFAEFANQQQADNLSEATFSTASQTSAAASYQASAASHQASTTSYQASASSYQASAASYQSSAARYQPLNLRESILEENLQLVNQNVFSATGHPTTLVQPNQFKRASRPPPGFETQVQDQELSWFPPSPGSHLNSFQMQPPQQHWQINNILIAPPNESIHQIGQSLIQTPQFYNMQPMNVQRNPCNNGWPQLPYVSPSPNYSPLNAFVTPPPPTPQNFSFPHPNSSHNFYQNQAYGGPSMVDYNCTSNTQNIHHYDRTSPNVLGKAPECSGDSSMPPPQFAQQKKVVEPLPVFQQSVVVPTTTASPVKIDQSQINRPNTPMTPSSLELANIFSGVRQEGDEPTLSESPKEIGVNLTEITAVEKQMNFKIDRLNDKTKIEKPLNPQHLLSPSGTRSSCTSEEYPSLGDTTESLSQNLQSLAIVNIPDSWEDICPDDMPAKSNNFSEDFKKSLDFIYKEESDAKPNQHASINLISETNKINVLPQTKNIETTRNWKDIFDPDNTINSEKNKILNKINEENSSKIRLVKKLELKHKFFHVICVNNKFAVLAHEFFPQFTTLSWQITNKVVETQYKPFTLICKKSYPALFSELDKIEFCGGIDKKSILKLGKASISYPSEIPSVCSVLNIKDPELMDKLKVEELLSTAT